MKMFQLLVTSIACTLAVVSANRAIYEDVECLNVEWRCGNSSLCSFGEVYQDCRCDALCETYRDCCYDTNGCSRSNPSSTRTFQCSTLRPFILPRPSSEIGSEEMLRWYWLAVECPSDWLSTTDSIVLEERESIQERCMNAVQLPVSDKATGFDYKNEFCALCNGVNASSIRYWQYSYACSIAQDDIDETFALTQSNLLEYCTFVNFFRPVFEIAETGTISATPRYCYPTQPRTCLDHPTLQTVTGMTVENDEYNSLKASCEQGATQALTQVRRNDFPYSNPFCALCNGYSLNDLQCHSISEGGRLTTEYAIGFKLYLLSRIYYPDSSSVINIESTIALDGQQLNILCTNQDSGQTSCLGDSVEFGLFLVINRQGQLVASLNTGLPLNTLFDIRHTPEEHNVTYRANSTENPYQYPDGYYVLTYVGCSLSVIGCLLVLLTSALFRELRSLPGKLLMNLAIAILITNLLIILGGPVTASFPEDKGLCVSTAILLHFFCLSQFSWMCVMSTEVVRSFYNAHKMIPKDNFTKDTKLLVLYIILGWTIPSVGTLITIIVNFSTDDLVLYGIIEDEAAGRCWINHPKSLIVAFITPVAIAIAFNLVTFLVVCVVLIQARCLQTKLHTNSNKFPYFRASIAIFTVSGITWIFGFIAIPFHAMWAWYPFIVLNSTQGLLIFLSFLCTKKVGKLYLSLLTRKKRKTQDQQNSSSQSIATQGITNPV